MRVSPRGWKMEPAPGSSAGVERPCCPMPAKRPLERTPRADAAAPTSATRFKKPRRVTVFRDVASFWPAIVCCTPLAKLATTDNCRRAPADCKHQGAGCERRCARVGHPTPRPRSLRNSSQTVDTRHEGGLTCFPWREHRRWYVRAASLRPIQKQAGLPATLFKCRPSDDVNDRPRPHVDNGI